jgi:hypothetical protein
MCTERSARSIDSPVAQSPESAVSHNETTEVLRLALAALDDPLSRATSNVVALHILNKLFDGEPLSVEGYQAAVERYASFLKAVHMEGACSAFRHLLLENLKLELQALEGKQEH